MVLENLLMGSTEMGGREQEETASFHLVSVCSWRAWHIPEDAGWSWCGRTGLWRFPATGEGSQAPVVSGIEIGSVMAHLSSLK